MQTALKTPSSESFVAKWKNSSKRAHALLFAGPEGSGKRETARAVAADALKTDSETHSDLIRIAPEKNSIKIESIRELIGRIALKPVQAERMVVIVEEADSMTTGAANALLKTLEEPPPYVLFLLLTSRPEELPATIRSRCQKVRFQVSGSTVRQNLEALYASWESELALLWPQPRSPFAVASKITEAVTADTSRIDSLWDLLKALWHDLAILNAGAKDELRLVPSASMKVVGMASRKPLERIFDDLDLILETERALDGNVNKSLALERLFYRLVG